MRSVHESPTALAPSRGPGTPLRVGIDIDGVMADFVGAFCAEVRQRYGTALRREEVRAHDVALAIGLTHDEAEELIDDVLEGPAVRCLPGAPEGLAALVSAGIEVAVVTARFRGEHDAEAKVRRWLARAGLADGRHFHHVATLPEGQKHSVGLPLDCVVDDNLTELLRFFQHRTDIGHRIVFNQPWNATKDVLGRFHRVHGWHDLTEYLLTLSRESSEAAVRQAAPDS